MTNDDVVIGEWIEEKQLSWEAILDFLIIFCAGFALFFVWLDYTVNSV